MAHERRSEWEMRARVSHWVVGMVYGVLGEEWMSSDSAGMEGGEQVRGV
jgi:hypothetical protein